MTFRSEVAARFRSCSSSSGFAVVFCAAERFSEAGLRLFLSYSDVCDQVRFPLLVYLAKIASLIVCANLECPALLNYLWLILGLLEN